MDCKGRIWAREHSFEAWIRRGTRSWKHRGDPIFTSGEIPLRVVKTVFAPCRLLRQARLIPQPITDVVLKFSLNICVSPVSEQYQSCSLCSTLPTTMRTDL